MGDSMPAYIQGAGEPSTLVMLRAAIQLFLLGGRRKRAEGGKRLSFSEVVPKAAH